MLSKLDYECISKYQNNKMYRIKKIGYYLKKNGVKEFKNRIEQRLSERNINNQYNIILKTNTIYIICQDRKKYDLVVNNKELSDYFNKIKFEIKPFLLVKKYSKNKQVDEINYFDLKYLFRYKSFIYFTNSKNKLELNNNFIVVNDINNILNNLDSLEYLKLFANYINNNIVSVRCTTFYDFNGYNYYCGGAERYLCDLYEIFNSMNVTMDIYQEATKPFFRKYRNINVIGLSSKQPIDYSEEYYNDKYFKYLYATKNVSQLHIYSAFFEAFPWSLKPSIGISHGIGWDNISNVWKTGLDFEYEKQNIITSALMCDDLVSVDTNTCNWFQTIDYNLGARKFNVIPNYVDVNEFVPRKNYLEVEDKIIITYPRRLYAARGLYILLDISDKLLQKYKNIEIHLVGKGNEYDLKNINKVVKKYKDRMFCYHKSPEEMHEVYKKTDISVIPTIFSEGTSLSCLEAMASGNLVISTRVGGLSDLIIDRYNGYLIEPSQDALFDALCDAIDNYSDRIIFKERAREVAKAFNKEIWSEKWKKVINKYKYKTSSNVELVEFVINDITKLDKNILEKIRLSLISNKLVYIREKNNSKLNNSCERLQFIDFYSKDESIAHKVYYENNDLKKDLKGILNEKN